MKLSLGQFFHFGFLSLLLGTLYMAPVLAQNAGYDHQIVLTLGTGKTAKGLKEKAAGKNLVSESIDLREKDYEKELPLLKKLTPKSRLYLVGHCNAKLDTISSDEKVSLTYNDYADMLEKHAPQLINADGKIKISLIACYAGVGGEKSFAGKLSKALDQKKIPHIIYARTGEVSRHKKGKYKKLVDGKHQQPGSKLIFQTEEGITNITPFIYKKVEKEDSTGVACKESSPKDDGVKNLESVVKALPPQVVKVSDRNKASKIIQDLPPGSFVFWPSSSLKGAIGFYRKDKDGNVDDLPDLIRPDVKAGKKIGNTTVVEDLSDAKEKIASLPNDSALVWKSKTVSGVFEMIQKNPDGSVDASPFNLN